MITLNNNDVSMRGSRFLTEYISPKPMQDVEEARPVADPPLRGRLVLVDSANGEASCPSR